jgi:energy-coupling factor transporter ATP-binding protein EcfA2
MPQTKTKPEIEVASFASFQKKLVIVTGDKGGTGKSTLSRGLVDIANHRGVSYVAYDSDKRNSQLYRHYQNTGGGISRLDFSTEDGADNLIVQMDTGTSQLIIVDLPAGGGELLEKYNLQLGLLSEAQDMGYDITIVSVMSRVKDSVNALRLLMDFTGDAAKHLAIKNLYWGTEDKFSLFDQSKVKQRLLDDGGLVINLPDMCDATYALIDEHNLTFRAALDDTEHIPRPHRSRIHQWLRLLETEIDLANKYLGV